MRPEIKIIKTADARTHRDIGAKIGLYWYEIDVSRGDELRPLALQVQVRQDKVNPASSVETAVNLGTNAFTLVEIKLSSKQQMKRMKRKKKAGADDGSQDDEPPDEPGLTS